MNIRIRYIPIILITLLAMSYLFVQTKSIDINKHNQLINHFAQFMLIDSRLNQNILEVRQVILTSYDSTVGKTNQLHKLLAEIKFILKNTQPKHIGNFTPLIESAIKSLDVKENNIENFKSINSIFTNSLRYLPTATNQLSEKLPLDTQGDVVTLLLTEQLRDILIYNYSNDKVILDKLNETNKLLTTIFKKNYPNLLNELASLQAHTKVIIHNKQKIDRVVSDILTTPSAKKTNDILALYISIYNQKMKQVNFYQKILYSLLIGLLLYVAYILSRLNKTGRILQKTINDLKYQKSAIDQHAIVSILDTNGCIQYANDKFCHISGYEFNELINQSYTITKASLHPNSADHSFSKALTHNEIWHGNIRHKNKSNGHYWTDTTLVPFMNDDNKPYQYVVIQTDVTDIFNATEKLHLQSAALEAAANGIVITDKSAKILWVNSAFTKMTGYTLDDTTNKTPKLLNSGKQTKSFYKDMWDTILNGQSWHGELINKRKDGSLYSEEQSISPVIDNTGKISHFISIKHDITQRQMIEEALRRSQKLDAVGQLSGGIAHDFNNQLGINLGYLDLVKASLKNEPTLSRYIDISIKSASRCVELTRQLLSFSSKHSAETSSINLNRLLKDQELIIAKSITPEIKIKYVLHEPLWTTKINSGDFQDSILNTVINARDAMGNDGTLTLTTQNINISTDNLNKPAGDFILVSITDTGTGMDKKTLDHIFEPFFTTKAQGKGTGLGMSMVYGFAKRSGGFVDINSELGTGTSINIYLPRFISEPCETPETNESKTCPTGTENILIVDDEPSLLRLTEKNLQSLGYQTFLANNAQEAIDILSKEKNIQLIFSDVVMPGNMNGYQLIKQALTEYPNLKALLTSGHTKDSSQKEMPLNFSVAQLKKPYNIFELATHIREALDQD